MNNDILTPHGFIASIKLARLCERSAAIKPWIWQQRNNNNKQCMHNSCESYQALLLLMGWIAALRSQRRADAFDTTKPSRMKFMKRISCGLRLLIY